MSRAYFIAGTDTGVGKTLVSSALIYHFNRQGFSTVAMKPVAAGCVKTEKGWVNEDVEALRKAASVALTHEQICPYLLRSAIAPHIAASEERLNIDLHVIYEKFRALSSRGDKIIVEGVGGFQVPLNETYDTADLTVMMGLPVILVVGLRLGCLNHALLTTEAIHARGLTLVGWVANQIDPNMERVQQNIETLQHRIDGPLIGSIPFLSNLDVSNITLSV